MEWRSSGIVVSAAPFGEADAIVSALTEDHGLIRGLVRGGRSRRSRGCWDVGNRVVLRWTARLADQLGAFTGEASGTPLGALFDRPVALAALQSACAVAACSLPPGTASPQALAGLSHLIDLAVTDGPCLPGLVRWELVLLSELGYGLDLTGGRDAPLSFVSPRTGLAVDAVTAGSWASRLLPLPRFVLDPVRDPIAPPEDIRHGLALAGHFLLRDVWLPLGRRPPRERGRLIGLIDRASEQARVEANAR